VSIAAVARPLVVLGARGFVGRHLLADLAPHWHGPVLAVSRRAGPVVPAAVEVLQADPGAGSFWARQMPAGAVVVNLAWDAGGGRDANLALADAVTDACATAHANRLVHVSTAMVAGRARGPWIDERTECRPVTDYQRMKLEVETRVVDQSRDRFGLVVLRPTAVFGPGGLNLRKLARDLTTRTDVENYLRACLQGHRPMHLVPVETVVRAIEFAAREACATTDRLYVVAADDAPANNYIDVERVMRAALGLTRRRVPPVPLPGAALPVAMRAMGRLSSDPGARFSSVRLRQAGFVAPVTFEAALDAYAACAGDEIGRAAGGSQ
jgi:nucleoside-diphosphate-sugar epimerase